MSRAPGSANAVAGAASDERQAGRGIVQHVGLLGGLVCFAASQVLAPPAGLSTAAWTTAGVGTLMAVWWMSEALPLAVTGLVPVTFLPLFGAGDIEQVGGDYGNSTVFLILGGFLLALAMERWNLHRRIAYSIVVRAGGEPRRLVLGVMVATAFISMWTANTSTALMMIPVALSVAAVVVPGANPSRDERNFAAAVVLAVAYGATIGGLGTLIGTPTNAIVVGYMHDNHGVQISFVEWLAFGVPTVLLLLPLCWLVIVRWALPFQLPEHARAARAVDAAWRDLGAMGSAERRVACIFGLAATAWITRPVLGELPGLSALSDAAIALCAGMLLFIVPAGGEGTGALLDGEAVRRVPWDVLLLFGGGLALAAAIQDNGVAAAMAEVLSGLGGLPLWALTLSVTVLLVFWTELNSNVAAAATFTPILGALALATTYPPLSLVAPAAIAASCGFMLPVGTPPNAIVYATGRVALRDMMRAGVVADLLAVAVVTAVALVVLPLLV